MAAHPNSVYCYDPSNKTWSTVSDVYEVSLYPGTVTTGSKSYVFGGQYFVSDVGHWRDSVQMLDHETNTWAYIPTPLIEGQRYIQAITFEF